MDIKFVKIFFAIGVILIFIGFGIFFKIEYDEKIEEKNIQDINSQLIIKIEENVKQDTDSQPIVQEEEEEVIIEIIETEEILITNSSIYDNEPQKKTTAILIDGRKYIGYLEIPSRNIQWPILSSYNDTDVKVAPALYYGNIDEGAVICGHNYKSHFGHLKYLELGDEIKFTDVNNNETYYVVEKIEILKPHKIPAMTITDYDLTLFTCTAGGAERLTLRFNKINK